MLPVLSEIELLRLRRKPSRSRMKEYFRQAIVAGVMAKGYENIKQPIEADFYRSRAIYFTAKGIEALAFDTAEGQS